MARDFGKDTDDTEFLETIAEDYGLDVTQLRKANIDYYTFCKDNRESIKIGKTIAAKVIMGDVTSTPADSKESLSDMLRKSNEREKSAEEIAVMRANGGNFCGKVSFVPKGKSENL